MNWGSTQVHRPPSSRRCSILHLSRFIAEAQSSTRFPPYPYGWVAIHRWPMVHSAKFNPDHTRVVVEQILPLYSVRVCIDVRLQRSYDSFMAMPIQIMISTLGRWGSPVPTPISTAMLTPSIIQSLPTPSTKCRLLLVSPHTLFSSHQWPLTLRTLP